MSGVSLTKASVSYESHLDGYLKKGSIDQATDTAAHTAVDTLNTAMQDPNATEQSLEQAASALIKAEKDVETELTNDGDNKGADQMAGELKNLLKDPAKQAGVSESTFQTNATMDVGTGADAPPAGYTADGPGKTYSGGPVTAGAGVEGSSGFASAGGSPTVTATDAHAIDGFAGGSSAISGDALSALEAAEGSGNGDGNGNGNGNSGLGSLSDLLSSL